MSDYISRAKVIEEINKYHMTSGVSNQGTWNECVDVISHTISEFPSADVRENIHGEWIKDERISYIFPIYRCSLCKNIQGNNIDNFCSNCGADMRGDT